MSQIRNCDWYHTLYGANFSLTQWVNYTEDEMKDSPTRQCLKGYLKQCTYKEACKNWWDSLSYENKQIIQTIPNFDKAIFFEITGIKL